jgi:insertion element IS1 protein InsB
METAPPKPDPIPPCPRCHSTHVVRNGKSRSGTPNFLCQACKRRFVASPRKGPVSDQTKQLIRRMLLERLSLRAIARITGVSRSWLQRYVNELYREKTPWEPGELKAGSGRLVLEADEMWSFVGKKKTTWWIWVALDAETRQVVAMMAGDRTDFTARCLWEAVPREYKDGATVYTDFLATYRAVMPPGRHVACGKDSGLTNHVERFWCTVRQRCGRFVRKSLSFSRCDSNHIGALWYFVRDYNASLL